MMFGGEEDFDDTHRADPEGDKHAVAWMLGIVAAVAAFLAALAHLSR